MPPTPLTPLEAESLKALKEAQINKYWLVIESWVSSQDLFYMFDPRLPRGPDLIRNMIFDDYSWNSAMKQAIKRKEEKEGK